MIEHPLEPPPFVPALPEDALAVAAATDVARSPVTRLGRLAARLADADTLQLVREHLAGAMRETLGVDQVHLVEISQDEEVAGAEVALPGLDGGMYVCERYRMALDDRPSGVATAVRTRRPLHVPHARDSGLVRDDHVERWNANGLLFIPVVVDGEVRLVAIGIWHVSTESTPEAVAAATALAGVTALALARVDAEERSRAEVRHHTSLLRAARALNASLELPEVLSTLCREADLALGGDIVGVYLGDATTGGVAVAGHNVPPGWEGQVMPPGAGVAGQTLVTGETAITNDYRGDTDVPDIEQLRAVRTAMSVPVRWDEQLRGALSVGFHELRRITREDVLLLEAIADLAASACQNASAYEKATAAATTDSLTGVLNHGAMQVRTAQEIERARRAGTPLSLVVLDLDDFKRLNDTYGHQAGDRFLRRVAGALGLASRPYDALARYGGDEFVLVLSGATARQAVGAAERLRDAVRATTHELGLPDVQVDASAGVAEWREPLTSAELLERADRALLLAKRRGKRNVAVAGPETDEELALLDLDAASTSSLVREFWEEVALADDATRPLEALPEMVRGALDLEEAALLDAGELRPAGGGLGRFDLGPRWRGSLAELLDAFGLEGPFPLREGEGSYAGVPLVRAGTLRGLLLLRARERDFPAERLQQAELIGRQASMLMAGRTGDGSPAAVRALAAAIDARDNYTHEHSAEVVSLARAVARRLGLDELEVERVERAALLHDVGKVAIPNEILHKAGPLDEDEWAVMREHPVIGEQILRRTPELADIAPLVRHEHERWDGGGYPDGIAGEAIPVGARIILACDAYNAMITRRPYREPMTEAAALAELRANAGSQFDPAVVDGLLAVLGA